METMRLTFIGHVSATAKNLYIAFFQQNSIGCIIMEQNPYWQYLKANTILEFKRSPSSKGKRLYILNDNGLARGIMIHEANFQAKVIVSAHSTNCVIPVATNWLATLRVGYALKTGKPGYLSLDASELKMLRHFIEEKPDFKARLLVKPYNQ